MPPEVAEKSQQTLSTTRPDGPRAHEAQSAWEPGSNYIKLRAIHDEYNLGTVCNYTFSQSLAHQYDDVAERAINGIGKGVGSMLALGAFGLSWLAMRPRLCSRC